MLQYINKKRIPYSYTPRVTKTQLKEDRLTLVRDIHTKLIHLQNILAIVHEINRCLLCSNSTKQKKQDPLVMFLFFNASPTNGGFM